ncbi:MAG TPA: AMP-binding protein, partial [Pilimelia sp.]|nr:AMP-binding protein [Pilimelia sp.]
MAELLSPHLAHKRDEAAVTDQDRTVTWAALDDRINRWIHLLRGSGLSAGDRVAVLSGNRHEAFEAALACLHAGFTLVPVNWHLTASEIAYILADSGSRAIIVDDERAAVAADAVAGIDAPVKVVTGGQPVAGFAALEPLLAAAAATEPGDQCSGSVLLYTSGTSGRPKGVVTSLFSTGAPLAAIAGLLGVLGQVLSVPDDGRTLLVGPWYHSGQLFFSLFPLLRGSSLLVRRGFDAAELVELIDR